MNGDFNDPINEKLSPLGRNVLKRTHLDHRLPTPVSPEASPSAINGTHHPLPPRTASPDVTAGAPIQPFKTSHTTSNNDVRSPQRNPLVQFHTTPKQQTPPGYKPFVAASSYHTPRVMDGRDAKRQLSLEEQSSQQTPSSRLVATAVKIPAPTVTPEKALYNETFSGTPTQRQSSWHHSATSTPMQGLQPMVVIPPMSADARKSDFVTRDLPSPDKVSRKRKRGFGEDGELLALQTKDQRADAESLVSELREALEEVFEADDEVNANPNFFLISNVADGDQSHREIKTLLLTKLSNIEGLLRKVNIYGRISEIPSEDIQRLQGLCTGALEIVNLGDLEFNSEWSAEEFASREDGLETLHLGLRAARTILRTMTGGCEDKAIYSEDHLINMIGTIRKATEICVIPVVEARPSSPGFDRLSDHTKMLSSIMHDVNKDLTLLCKLLTSEEMAEVVVTPIEDVAIKLLFVENAPWEKESVIGIQKFESLRRSSMDVVAAIFSRYPSQREFLLSEILGSVQKLPTGRQAARQYRLKDGRAIQVVSALIIQLVQTSSRLSRFKGQVSGTTARLACKEDGEGSESSSDDSSDIESGVSDESSHAGDSEVEDTTQKSAKFVQRLRKIALPLNKATAQSASHAVTYLMKRAQTSSKTGDDPHRLLLDLFVEDLLTVFSLPEWPGAEMLLRVICHRSMEAFENPKSLAPAKNLALELFGTMGSAISDLVATTRSAVRMLDGQDNPYNSYLSQRFDEYTDGTLELADLVSWDGPFHAIADHFERVGSDDQQTMSAQAYYLAQWAKSVSTFDLKALSDKERVARRLCTMLSGSEWISSEKLSGLTSTQISITYALTILNMDFCKRFDWMLRILIDSVTSEQTTVRSKGLKSVTQMLDRDPSILDRARSVKNIILRCASDNSPMVRDAALTLIGKCITIKPAQEADFLPHVLHLSNDAAVGVRKRSIKLLKDVYFRKSTSKETKSAISESIIHRTTDHDSGVLELARQTFEEIWIAPYWILTNDQQLNAQTDILLRNHVYLIMNTVTRRKTTTELLVLLFEKLLSSQSKNAAMDFKVCKMLVKTAFEVMIDDALKQSDILEVLTFFALANARLFDSNQLQFLQPYIGNLKDKDDLNVFRPVVIIFRCVLPMISTAEQSLLLQDIQAALLQTVSRLSKNELNEVAQCLWTINETLQNTDKLVRLVASVVTNLRSLQTRDFNDSSQKENLAKVKKLMFIAGMFGKHCDFEKFLNAFKNKAHWSRAKSVARLIVESLEPFTVKEQPMALRTVAFDCIGLVCQSHPSEFQEASVERAFVAILQTGDMELQEIILSSFREFFIIIEQSAARKPEDGSPQDNKSSTKLGNSMRADKRDEASSLISQYFLKDILPIALASQDASALTATEVIASINRQGAAFPKESIPTLVALGTSKIAEVSRIALEEHRRQHQLHETMFESEYLKGLDKAFQYHKTVFNDPVGFIEPPLTAKLNGLWDVVKMSKAKFQKKFLSSFCAKIDFEIEKLDMSSNPSTDLQLSRFLAENLAFFDFTRLDELLHSLSCVEKIVAGTGSGVAHSISTEIFHIVVQEENAQPPLVASQTNESPQVPPNEESDLNGVQSQASQVSPSQQQTIDPSRLRRLTTAAIILSILWDVRTYLRRLYGQSASNQKQGKGRPPTKDLNRAPTRLQGVSGEKLVATIADKVASLDSEEAMMAQCKEFVELLSVDSEVKVGAESEDGMADRTGTPGVDDEDDERDTPMSGASRGTKRKGSLSASVTPTKKRGRPPLGRKRSSARKSVEGDDSDEDWK